MWRSAESKCLSSLQNTDSSIQFWPSKPYYISRTGFFMNILLEARLTGEQMDAETSEI